MSRPCDRPSIRAVMLCNKGGKCRHWKRGTPAGQCPDIEGARGTYKAAGLPVHKVEGLDGVMGELFEHFPDAQLVGLEWESE